MIGNKKVNKDITSPIKMIIIIFLLWFSKIIKILIIYKDMILVFQLLITNFKILIIIMDRIILILLILNKIIYIVKTIWINYIKTNNISIKMDWMVKILCTRDLFTSKIKLILSKVIMETLWCINLLITKDHLTKSDTLWFCMKKTAKYWCKVFQITKIIRQIKIEKIKNKDYLFIKFNIQMICWCRFSVLK